MSDCAFLSAEECVEKEAAERKKRVHGVEMMTSRLLAARGKSVINSQYLCPPTEARTAAETRRHNEIAQSETTFQRHRTMLVFNYASSGCNATTYNTGTRGIRFRGLTGYGNPRGQTSAASIMLSKFHSDSFHALLYNHGGVQCLEYYILYRRDQVSWYIFQFSIFFIFMLINYWILVETFLANIS